MSPRRYSYSDNQPEHISVVGNKRVRAGEISWNLKNWILTISTHGGARNSKRLLIVQAGVRTLALLSFLAREKPPSPRRPLKRVIQWANTNRRLDNTEHVQSYKFANKMRRNDRATRIRSLDTAGRCTRSSTAVRDYTAPLPSHPSKYNTDDSWDEGDRVFECNNFGWASDPASRPPMLPPSPPSSFRFAPRGITLESHRAGSFNPLTRRRWG